MSTTLKMSALDAQLAELRIYANELEAKLQDELAQAEPPPAHPPHPSHPPHPQQLKPKPPLVPVAGKGKPAAPPPAPQVPQSCNVKSACEPSYSSRLECSSRNSSTVSAYSSVSRALAPRMRSGDALLYANLLPRGGTNHIYTNLPQLDPSQGHSDYSELRRPVDLSYRAEYAPSSASQVQDFSTYGGSQTSSTYESLYEPINPRPSSQMSTRSSSSLYAPYVSGPQGARSPDVPIYDRRPSQQDEQELYCGNCYNCGERILGETTGCTAMDRIYHIKCFCCQQCSVNLQGRPFYALNGRALCERDYLNTLEKCCVCAKPILDRILRATGKPYHPHCFTCVVCRQSLDGIPFTVDAMNRIHCIEDFHKRYAPRCARCREPVVPEPGAEETVRIVALDRSYHIKCYACEDCGVSLSSRQEGRGCYPLDHHLYCRSCNAARIQELTRNIN